MGKGLSKFEIDKRRNEILRKEKEKREKDLAKLSKVELKELKVKEIESRIKCIEGDLKNNTLNDTITKTRIRILTSQKNDVLKEIEDLKTKENDRDTKK